MLQISLKYKFIFILIAMLELINNHKRCNDIKVIRENI